MTAFNLLFSKNFSTTTALRFGNTDDATGELSATIAVVPDIHAEYGLPSFFGTVAGAIEVVSATDAYHVPHVATIAATILPDPEIVGFLPVTAEATGTLAVYVSATAYHSAHFGTISETLPIEATFSGKANDWDFFGTANAVFPVSAQVSSAHGVGGTVSSRIPIVPGISAHRGNKAAISAQLSPVISNVRAERGANGGVSARITAPAAHLVAAAGSGGSAFANIPMYSAVQASHMRTIFGSIAAQIEITAGVDVFNTDLPVDYVAFVLTRNKTVSRVGRHV